MSVLRLRIINDMVVMHYMQHELTHTEINTSVCYLTQGHFQKFSWEWAKRVGRRAEFNHKITTFVVIMSCTPHVCENFCLFKTCFDPKIFIQKPNCIKVKKCDQSTNINKGCFPTPYHLLLCVFIFLFSVDDVCN